MSRPATTTPTKNSKVIHQRYSPYYEIQNSNGTAPLVFVCEHASNSIPDPFESPLPNKELLNEHIAWDPGARALSAELSMFFDAPLLCSKVSRLIYDCNRPPESISAIPLKSERYEIPGNQNIDDSERQFRVEQIYTPFHAALSNLIADKQSAGIEPALVTIHSFTPTYFSQIRDTEIGILHDRDSRMADAMLNVASQLCKLVVERNKPYGPDDGVTHTLIKHGIHQALPNVMLEIKNDLLTNASDIKDMATVLQQMILQSLSKLVTAV